MTSRPAVVAFDVIETLFRLDALAPGLERLGVPGNQLPGWFAASLRDLFALAAVGQFQPLRAIMAVQLDELLARFGRTAGPDEAAAFLDGMASLPAHADAAEAIDLLLGAGIRVMALSNGGAAATGRLFEQAGLGSRVGPIVTIEEVRLGKPRAEVYRHAAERAGVEPARLMLAAVHPWDVNGAKAAGLMGGHVARGRPYPDFMARPDAEGEDLVGLARAIIALG